MRKNICFVYEREKREREREKFVQIIYFFTTEGEREVKVKF